MRPHIRASLDRVVAKGTAIGAPPTGLALLLIGISTPSTGMLLIAATAFAVSVMALWQLRSGRASAIALNLVSAGGVGTAMLFFPLEISAGVGSGIVVFQLTGIPVVRGKAAAGYTAFHLAALAASPLAALLAGEPISSGVLAVYSLQAGVLGFGTFVLHGLSAEIASREARYEYLFSHAPVALWENDFSMVGAWLDRLRTAGVEDIRTYLTENPDELAWGIGLVTTTNANRAAAEIVGAGEPHEMLGPFPYEVIDPESQRLFLEQFVQVYEGGPGGEHEYTGLTLDGDDFRGVFSWANPQLNGGDLSRVVTAVSDLTDLRRAEEQLAATATMREALLSAIPDLLFLCDADGTFRDFYMPQGDSDTDLYVQPEAFLGRSPGDVLPPELAERILQAITVALETGLVQTFEYELEVAGVLRFWESRISPIPGRAQALSLVRDMTGTIEARRALERLVRSKDDFIAAISHEIRTPLTGIVGFARLLNGEEGGLDEAERRQMIEALEDQSIDLTNIVEDLLVAAKADLGRLQVAAVPTNLRAQAAQVLEGWDRKGIGRIEIVGDAPTCRADPGRVRQIIRNLISNAIRYGGDRIEVRIDEGVTVGRLTVVDNGRGMAPEDAEKAFEPYHRLAPQDGLTAALGIGLPISRNLARLMTGDLVYRRVEGETHFTLTLPLADKKADVRQRSAATPAGVLGRNTRR